MIIIGQRHAELRAEAAAIRSVGACVPRHDRFSGLQIRVGSLLIMVGRTVAQEKSHPKPIHF